MSYCDLHLHSTASDGSDTPAALAGLAREAGLAAIALTDHDNCDGVAACRAACEDEGIAFVAGIEVSADPGPIRKAIISVTGDDADDLQRGTLHILGLFIDETDPQLDAVRQRMTEARDSRNPAIVERLQKLGVKITYDEVLKLANDQGTKVIGRPHIAQVLQQKGYVKSVQDAFRRYIGRGGPAYERRDRLHPREAIDAIHHAGGLAILAHPVQLKLPDMDCLEHFAAQLREFGLDGIEAIHCDHTGSEVAAFRELADRRGLLISGGSDYHGYRKSVELGSQRVPMAVYERLRDARKKRATAV